MAGEPHLEPYGRIGEVSARIRDGSLSPVGVVQACLSRIARLNPSLNAFITVLADDAMAHARIAASDVAAGRWRGPLHGIPIAIKDFYDTAGVKTTAAAAQFKHRVPARDADSVARLKDAGAIVVGKTNMDRLGMGTTGLVSDFGPVRNPWDDAYIPGGSSSGSAAAVAAGLCYATLDTDAVGSCRLPAACCGVVGFKGTSGAISARGILDGEPVDEAILWLSHPGLTTRSASDTAILLDALAGPGAADGTRLRIGIADRFKADEAVTAAFHGAIDVLRRLDHHVAAADARFDTPRFGDVHAIEGDRKAISSVAFKDTDVFVLPTIPTSVPAVKDASGNPQALSAANTMFANYFGLPAVSVPCGFDQRGLPIGLQLVGKPGGDHTVLRLAQQYEAASPFRGRHPNV
jgi:aspartyl-tRNA(Asn)/glutamyl-tRNA(Gln) amidotransferase subunit A